MDEITLILLALAVVMLTFTVGRYRKALLNLAATLDAQSAAMNAQTRALGFLVDEARAHRAGSR